VELTLTGEMKDAAWAHSVGLVSGVVPRDQLLEEAKSLLRKITKNGPVAVRMALESIYRAMDATLMEGLATEASLFGLLASTGDMKEGMTAFLEKRKPDFQGR
jgi:enoyl-CoA hydratase/carnithine racemase